MYLLIYMDSFFLFKECFFLLLVFIPRADDDIFLAYGLVNHEKGDFKILASSVSITRKELFVKIDKIFVKFVGINCFNYRLFQ